MVTESVCVLNVTRGKTSGLGIVFLSRYSIRISGLSTATSEEFYCIFLF